METLILKYKSKKIIKFHHHLNNPFLNSKGWKLLKIIVKYDELETLKLSYKIK